MNNKTKIMAAGVAFIGIIAVATHAMANDGGGENSAYGETRAGADSLAEGSADERTPETGTVRQIFIMDAGTLEVEDVRITEGQRIKEGDIICTLTKESVDKARAALVAEIDEAKTAYRSLQAGQEEAQTQARQGYDTYVMNGKYAQTVCDDGLRTYREALDKAVEAVKQRQDEYNEAFVALVKLNEELAGAQTVLREAQGVVSENYEGRYENAYYYTVYLNAMEAAQKLSDQLEEGVRTKEAQAGQLAIDIQSAVRAMNRKQLEYEKAQLELGRTRDMDVYYGSVASKWQDMRAKALVGELSFAEKRYNLAVEKLDRFDSYVQGGAIFSEYRGIVANVPVSKGSTVSGGRVIAVFDGGGKH